MSDTSSLNSRLLKRSSGNTLVHIIIVIVIVLVALYAISAYTPLNILGVNKQATSTNWKAVFLTNGQVYFGHVENEASDPVVLRDIYYLQVVQPLQQLREGQTPPATPQQPQLSLVKLGNELHGPEDEMRVNRAHMIFVENLKDNGRVVEAINNYIASQSEGE